MCVRVSSPECVYVHECVLKFVFVCVPSHFGLLKSMISDSLNETIIPSNRTPTTGTLVFLNFPFCVVCVCVCCECVCVCVCVCVCAYECVCMYVCMYVCLCLCVSVWCVCVCVWCVEYVCVCVNVHVSIVRVCVSLCGQAVCFCCVNTNNRKIKHNHNTDKQRTFNAAAPTQGSASQHKFFTVGGKCVLNNTNTPTHTQN